MALVELSPTTLTIHIEGLDQLWSFKSRLDIPLAHVRHATIDPDGVKAGPQGWRLPGTHLPGIITAGTYIQKGERVFWDVHDPDQAVVIYLEDDRFDGLVIQVDDPAVVVAAINAATRGNVW